MQQSFFLCDTQEKLLLCKGKSGLADAKPPFLYGSLRRLRGLRNLLHCTETVMIEVIGFTSVIRA